MGRWVKSTNKTTNKNTYFQLFFRFLNVFYEFLFLQISRNITNFYKLFQVFTKLYIFQDFQLRVWANFYKCLLISTNFCNHSYKFLIFSRKKCENMSPYYIFHHRLNSTTKNLSFTSVLIDLLNFNMLKML